VGGSEIEATRVAYFRGNINNILFPLVTLTSQTYSEEKRLHASGPSGYTLPRFTLMLHTYVEEKRARVRQMWPRTDSDRSRRT